MFLLPSLNRPKQLEKCLTSMVGTMAGSPGLVLVDETDPAKSEYEKIILPVGWDYVWTKGVTMGEKIAEVWPKLEKSSYVGIINDDFEFITKDWDKKLIAYLDGKNFVSTNDRKIRSWMKPSGVTVWSKPLLDHLGWRSFFPPGLQHLFIDDVWLLLGTNAGLWRMAAEVVVLHHHVLDGEMDKDSTFHKTYDPFFAGTSRDKSVFDLFVQHDFKPTLDKILKFQDFAIGEQHNPKVFSKNASKYDMELKEG